MASFNIVVRSNKEEEPIYSRTVAARLARVSLDFLQRCEQERLIQTHVTRGGKRGYTAADVEQLARIRRLREGLELDLAAVEVILHLRQRVLELLKEIETMERRHARREQELLNEIHRLRRRLAEEAIWQM